MNRSVSRRTSFRRRPPCARLDPPGLVSPAGLPLTALASVAAAFLIHGSVPAGAAAAQTVEGRPVAWFLPPLDEDERPVGRVLDARDGRVLLLRRGELGVEEIQVHRLELRPPDAAR